MIIPGKNSELLAEVLRMSNSSIAIVAKNLRLSQRSLSIMLAGGDPGYYVFSKILANYLSLQLKANDMQLVSCA